jgi:hypothetical protein
LLFKDYNWSIELIFVKVFVSLICIFIFFFGFESYWILARCKKKRNNIVWQLISTMIIIIETFNSDLLIQIASVISCEYIDGEYFLSHYLKINCNDNDFKFKVNLFYFFKY